MSGMEHFLDMVHHGDCIELIRNIPDNSIDMVFTDPPYGHNNNNNGDLIHNREKALGKRQKEECIPRPIQNDGQEANEILIALLPEIKRVLKPGGCCCCCCCGGGPDPQFARWSLLIGDVLEFKQMIVWDKGPMGMGWHYRRSYEVVLVAQKPGAACFWFDNTSKVENIIRPGRLGIKKIIPSACDHPTPKPPELAAHFIKLHTQKGGIVLDCFLGGGSTAIAAKRLGRRWIGFEIDEVFVKMAREQIDLEDKQLRMF